MSTISRVDLLDFMRDQSLAVVASVSDAGAPEAAVVGIAVNDRFEVVFDALTSSRKARNLRARPSAALVIGGMAPGDERTVQYEGISDEPGLQDLELLKEFYFLRFPEGAPAEPVARLDVSAVAASLDSLQRLQPRPAAGCRVR